MIIFCSKLPKIWEDGGSPFFSTGPHCNAKLVIKLSLEQRREKQLYSLMYKLSNKGKARKVNNRNTRNHQKYVVKTDTKVGTKYEKSPFYQGTQLWDKLPKETKFTDNIFKFKKEIAKRYRYYKE